MPRLARQSLSKRAGLLFSAGRTRRHLKAGRYTLRTGKYAPVYLTAVLEYLAAEVLELAGQAARDNTKKRVTARHLMLGIANDTELSPLFKGAIMPKAGVRPHVERAILPKAKAHAGDSAAQAF